VQGGVSTEIIVRPYVLKEPGYRSRYMD